VKAIIVRIRIFDKPTKETMSIMKQIAYKFNMELFPVLKHSRLFNDRAYKHRLEKIARGRR
jgi:hypothetical protein